MNCGQIARLIDELIDGTLDPARASGVRGHARGCPACAARLAETEALVAAMSHLEPLEPPASLWTSIRSELDRAEAVDAARPRWWWWWQGARKQVAFGGAALVAASLCVGVWTWRQRQLDDGTRPAVAPVIAVVPAPVAAEPSDPIDDAVAEVQRAEADYQKAMDELERAVAGEKPRWRADAAHAFDANLATIDQAVEKQRAAFRLHPTDLDALDALHASYRARIDFLQEAVVRGGMTPKETL